MTEQSTEGAAELARWLAGPRDQPRLLHVERGGPDLAALLERDHGLFSETPPSPARRGQLLDRVAQ